MQIASYKVFLLITQASASPTCAVHSFADCSGLVLSLITFPGHPASPVCAVLLSAPQVQLISTDTVQMAVLSTQSDDVTPPLGT